MRTHINNVPYNFNKLDEKILSGFYKNTVKKIKDGSIQYVMPFETITNACGFAIGEMFVGKNVDPSPWKKSSSKYLKDTIYDYINATKVCKRLISKNVGVPVSSLCKYERGEIIPTLKNIQSFADFWGIEVADLFLPTKKDNIDQIVVITSSGNYEEEKKKVIPYDDENADKRISHIKWVGYNFTKLLEIHSVDNADNKIKKIASEGNGSLNSIEYYSNFYGSKIGNVFLKPGIKTSWYEESSVIYLSFNLERFLIEKNISAYNLSKSTKTCSSDAVYKFVRGVKVPTLVQMQDIANALDAEISDFFLPPDGM